MSYTPTTDFLALIRSTASGAALLEVPGLDYIVSALARAGLFQLSTGQTAPTANQATTVWLRPASPSWSAEGAVWLYNLDAAAYQPATPFLWSRLIANAWTGAPAPVFDAIAPTTTRGDLIVRGTTANQRLPIGQPGLALVSNGTDVVWQQSAVTVAQLPTPVVAGARAFVTDATSAVFGTTPVVGGGANKVPVVYNGTAWQVG